ncbi:MAG: hypothetical protein ACI8PZ_005064 [Myxococcota bacterium]|jgi:hypothetical protein
MLMLLPLLLAGPAHASQLLTGSWINVWYGDAGQWNDSGHGLEINTAAGWADVTYPGSPWQQTSIEYNAPGSYSYESNNGFATFTTLVESNLSVGSTNESYYLWSMPGLEIEKREVWDDGSKAMSVSFVATNTGGSTITDFRLMHAIDPDQDYGPYGDFNTYNDVNGAGDFATSEGGTSRVAVTYGACQPAKQDVGHTASWDVDADALFDDFGGAAGDYAMHWRHWETSIPVGGSIEFGFVMLWDASKATAESVWAADGPELCDAACSDLDGDGYSDVACGGDDCDDGDPSIHPFAPELCDDRDQDCDGRIDEGIVDVPWFADDDDDGFGDPADSVRDCAAPDGYVVNSRDCDDTRADIHPGADEWCNDLDDDCDGVIDDNALDADEVWPDNDDDGFGRPVGSIFACGIPLGYADNPDDCDDLDPGVNPDAEEIPYDGIDQDCDGLDLGDVDGDGHLAMPHGGDCNDFDARMNPDRIEVANGIDDDCDGVVDEGTPAYDDDGDGYTELGGDCDDDEPRIHPSAAERCDGIDNDCDRLVDEGTECFDDDGDGYTEEDGDCNDSDRRVYPGAPEIMGDGADNDCDGVVDRGETDLDGDGVSEFGGDCNDDDPEMVPGGIEVADGKDNDCDGLIDEGTELYDDDGDGASEFGGDCDDSDSDVGPAADEEPGNGVDDDCDGEVDEDGPNTDDDGDGFTEDGGDCHDYDDTIHPGAEEIDDGVDNDCDGLIDEEEDGDLDGFTVGDGDCDDRDGWSNPGMDEMCDNIDNNCNGIVDEGCDGEEVQGAGQGKITGCACTSGGPSVGPWWLLALALWRRRTGARGLVSNP